MIVKILHLISVLLLTSRSYQLTSLCPDILEYEPPEPNPIISRWFANTKLKTPTTLLGLQLVIGLDSKAELLSNTVGEVTTKNNYDFDIKNSNYKVKAGPPYQNLRFSVKFDKEMKPPQVEYIQLNGRNICGTGRITEGYSVGYSSSSGGASSVFDSETGTIKQTSWSSSNGKTVYNTSEIKKVDSFLPPFSILTTTARPAPIQPKSVLTPCVNCGDEEYDPDTAPINDDEYFVGGLPSARDLEEAHMTPIQAPNACGVIFKKANPLILNGRPTKAGEWPWQVALFLTRNFESRYACGGTLITLNYVTTAAHCVTRRKTRRVVPRNTITLYMGKHNLRTTIDGVQIRYVAQILVHEQYDPLTFNQDLALLRLHEQVTYTDTVRPACLWPQEQEDLSSVIGQRGTVVGWGYDGSGKTSEELTLVEMPVVGQDVCVRSHPLFFGKFTSITTYCAGYRNGSSACNGDSGGGMVFNLQGVWYLRGLVSLSVAKSREQHTCDPNHYIIFTDIAKSLKWIKDVVLESEKNSYTKLFS